MRTFAIAVLVAAATVAAASTTTSTEYRFDDVKRKVTVTSSNQELRVETGAHARGGDRVETGWFSYALIASEGYRAKFELFSATDVTLADGKTPGVILSLERGRIRAAFDKLLGTEPRVVKTPGALLAVRGTKFDVEVDQAGDTTVDVFEGVVEIRSPMRNDSLFVRAGEQSIFGRQTPPMARPMPEDRRRRGPQSGDGGQRGTMRPNDGPPRDRGGVPPRPNQGGQQPPPQPPHGTGSGHKP